MRKGDPAVPTSAEMIALAIELEKEGQYNTAKLLRAAADAILRRAAHQTETATERVEQVELLRRYASALADTPAAALAEPMERAADAITAGKVPLISEAPDPYVCRLCGRVQTEPFSERCAHCGAWPSTAARTRPIYWLRESDPGEAIARLRTAPGTIGTLLGDLDDDRPSRPGPDGGWSAHEVLEHLHRAQGVLRERLDLLLGQDDPDLVSAMVWTWTGEDASTTADLFDAYRSLRSEIIGILERVPDDAWWRTGRHQEWGRVTLLEQVSYFANHEPTHLAQLADAAAG